MLSLKRENEFLYMSAAVLGAVDNICASLLHSFHGGWVR